MLRLANLLYVVPPCLGCGYGLTSIQYDYVEVTRDIVNGIEASETGSKRTITPADDHPTMIDTKS